MIDYSIEIDANGLCDFLNKNHIKKENIISIFRQPVNDDTYYVVIYETNV